MSENKIKKGDKLFYVSHNQKRTFDVWVTRVTRNYIYLKTEAGTKYEVSITISGLHGSFGDRAYLSQTEYLEECERALIVRELIDAIHDLSLGQLRRMYAILCKKPEGVR